MPTPVSRRPDPRRTSRRRPRSPRFAAVFAAVVVGASLVVGSASSALATPTPPPNPSDAQIGAAQTTKTQLATEVGALTAQLSQLKLKVEQLQAAAELAEQKYAYAVSQLAEAKTKATAAKAAVTTAQKDVAAAQTAFNASVKAGYLAGAATQGGTGALFAADDPTELLQSSAFQSYVTSHQADGIGRLNRAKVAKANADAAARQAVDTQTRLTTAAEQAYTDARAAESVAQQEQASTESQAAAVQTKLDTAQAALLGLQDQRTKYNAWKAEQARIAAAQERARQEAQRRAAAAEAARQAAIAAAQQQQQEQAGNDGGGSSNGGGGAPSGGGGGSSSGSPSGGSWTPAMGQAAVNRAMKWLGQPYAFAGGNTNGPTYGVCQSGAAWNDCHVYGFDCSGLVLYAWAPWTYMPHYTVAMWSQMSGNFHPTTNQLMPGDLLYYGYSAGTIHHVAMYIGNGNVIQAPQSGDHVRITSIWNMGSDYYGAVRPLT
ncbi:NlpC/P60 family protein [Jatrophihabitans sp. YIM 134969]